MEMEEFKLYFSFANLFIYNNNFSESLKANSKRLGDVFCILTVAKDIERL